jgi:hypothetical protein
MSQWDFYVGGLRCGLNTDKRRDLLLLEREPRLLRVSLRAQNGRRRRTSCRAPEEHNNSHDGKNNAPPVSDETNPGKTK